MDVRIAVGPVSWPDNHLVTRDAGWPTPVTPGDVTYENTRSRPERTLAERESAQLAQELAAAACAKQQIDPGCGQMCQKSQC